MYVVEEDRTDHALVVPGSLVNRRFTRPKFSIAIPSTMH